MDTKQDIYFILLRDVQHIQTGVLQKSVLVLGMVAGALCFLFGLTRRGRWLILA